MPTPGEEAVSQAQPLSKQEPWEQYPAINQVPHLVETRYAGFQEPGEYGTLFLPEILLDSPDGEAANQSLEELYLEGPSEDLAYDGWEPDWDYVWYEAYEWNGLLSVGIFWNNMFGCTYVLRGWVFDLENGRCLTTDKTLERLGMARELLIKGVRERLAGFVERTYVSIQESGFKTFIEEYAEENYVRLTKEIREGLHDPVDPAICLTADGDICLSVWDPSEQFWYDGGNGDWTEKIIIERSEGAD